MGSEETAPLSRTSEKEIIQWVSLKPSGKPQKALHLTVERSCRVASTESPVVVEESDPDVTYATESFEWDPLDMTSDVEPQCLSDVRAALFVRVTCVFVNPFNPD